MSYKEDAKEFYEYCEKNDKCKVRCIDEEIDYVCEENTHKFITDNNKIYNYLKEVKKEKPEIFNDYRKKLNSEFVKIRMDKKKSQEANKTNAENREIVENKKKFNKLLNELIQKKIPPPPPNKPKKLSETKTVEANTANTANTENTENIGKVENEKNVSPLSSSFSDNSQKKNESNKDDSVINKMKQNPKYSIALIIVTILFFITLGFTISDFNSRVCGPVSDPTNQFVIDYNVARTKANDAQNILKKSQQQLVDYNAFIALKNSLATANTNLATAQQDAANLATATSNYNKEMGDLTTLQTNLAAAQTDLTLKQQAVASTQQALTDAQAAVTSAQSASANAVKLQQNYQTVLNAFNTSQSNVNAATLDVTNKKNASTSAAAKCVTVAN